MVRGWVQALDVSRSFQLQIIIHSTHFKCPYIKRSCPSIHTPSESCAGVSVFSLFLPVAVMKLNKYRCNYWDEKEHLPPFFFSALPLHSQHGCKLPASSPRSLAFFFPWLWSHHRPRALLCCDEWAAACWWEANVSKLPAAFTSTKLDSKPNLQAKAKQLNSNLPTAATANEPLTWHELSCWQQHSIPLPAPRPWERGESSAAHTRHSMLKSSIF